MRKIHVLMIFFLLLIHSINVTALLTLEEEIHFRRSTIETTPLDAMERDVEEKSERGVFFSKKPNGTPFIGHIAVTSSHPNKPVEIRASIVGKVEQALVCYRKEGESAFNSVPMSLTDDSIYTGVIPGEDVKLGVLEYYIEVKDTSGSLKRDPPNKFYRIKVSKTVWRPIGPWMGYIWSLAIDPNNPNVIYNFADFGLWKSIDGGRNWSSINGEGPDIHLGGTALAVDPQRPNILYAASLNEFVVEGNRGIFKSEDGGFTWENKGLKGVCIYGITIDPHNPEVVYVCTSQRTFLEPLNKGNLYRSKNGDWEIIDVIPDQDDPGFSVLVVDPSSPSTLYVGTWGMGIYKSTDGGEHWELITPESANPIYVIPKGLTINPPDTIYALITDKVNWAKRTDYVYRSRDGGLTWESIREGLPFPHIFYCPYRTGARLLVDSKDSEKLYLATNNGIYRSEDNGESWKPINKIQADPLVPSWCYSGVTSLAMDPKKHKVYAGGWAGFFRKDEEDCWIQSNKGFQNIWAHRIEIDPKSNIYVGTGELRAYKSEDQGRSWTQLYEGLVAEPYAGYDKVLSVDRIIIDPNMPDTVYAGLYGGDPVKGKHGILCKSTDGGETWVRKTKGMPKYSRIYGLAIAPSNPSILYAGFDEHGIYKSQDGAESWEYYGLPSHRIWKIAVDPFNPNVVYAGVDRSSTSTGVYRLKESWDLVLENREVRDIAINPRDPNIIYVACDNHGGLHKSEDGGETWRQIPNEETDVSLTGVVLDPRVPDVVYVEVYNNDGTVSIFRSQDGGENWELFLTGIEALGPSSLKRGTIKVDPVVPNKLYITTWGVGSFVCEVTPGEFDHYRLYAPREVIANIPFKLEIIAHDNDSWIVMDYNGIATLAADKGSVFPNKAGNFVDGIATLNISLDTPGTVTLTVRDSLNPTKYGTVTIIVKEQSEDVKVSIKKPKRKHLYILDKEVTPTPRNTLIIGSIKIEAEAHSDITKVEFYIDNILKNIDAEEPYNWFWNEFAIGIHEIKAVAYDKKGNVASDEVRVIIFNSGR